MTGSLIEAAVNATTESSTMTGISTYTRAYEKLMKSRPGMLASELGGELAWMRKARERDALRWQRLGIPTRQSERWRYTSLAPVTEVDIALPKDAAGERLSRAAFPILAGDVDEIVFLNGHYMADWSRVTRDAGISVVVLSKLFEDCVADGWSSERLDKFAHFRKHIETSDADRETVFASMNTSFMQDGVLIQFEPGAVIEKPIVVSFFTDRASLGSEQQVPMISPRLFAHLGRGASGVVVECYAGLGEAPYFTNTVTDIRLEEGARLSHSKVQLESDSGAHIGTTRVHQAKDSFSETFQFTFGAKLSRQDLHISLEAPGAESFLDGLYLVDGKRHADNYTRVDHVSPHTTSEQVYKGVLRDEARAVFNGHVAIFKDAQKSSASQLNNNLLMSPKAEIDTRPELEIDADDVKAAHGATIGRIDPEQVFYLQTRAISKEQATRQLAQGFAMDIAFRVRNERLRKMMIELVSDQFAGQFDAIGGGNG